MPIQVNNPTPIPAVLPKQYVEVQTKENWTDDWVSQKYIEPISAAARLVPSMVRAEMRYLYGKHLREDTAALAWETPLDLTGHYCRIRSLSSSGPITHFVGVFVDEETQSYGVNKTAGHADYDKPTGDQALVAYDLTHLIDRVEITGSVFYRSPDPVGCERVLQFNYADVVGGGLAGNRYLNKATYNGQDVYLFTDSYVPASVETWSYLNMVEYLLAVFSGGLPFTVKIAGQYAALDGIVEAFNPAGKSLLDCLNLLINRKHGFGWYLSADATVPTINVFSTSGTAIDIGSASIPANQTQVALNIDNAVNVKQAVTIKNTSRKYQRVIAEGDFVKVQASYHKSAASFVEGWTYSIEQDYQNVLGDSPEERDKNRRRDRFRGVYQHYQVSQNWTGQGVLADGCMPAVTPKGEITLGLMSAADPFFWTGKRFLRHLITTIDTGLDRQEFGQPIVLIRDEETEAYHLAETIKSDQCNGFHIRLLDSCMGIELRGTINHLLALGDYSPGTSDSEITPVFSNENIKFTAAFETDTRIKYTAEIPDLAAGAGETLRLRFPAAQCWIVGENTIKGVDDSGAIEYWTAAEDGDGSNIIRNDVAYLEARAKAALSWYSQDRSLLTLKLEGLAYPYALGTYITQAAHGTEAAAVGTVVSSIEWDFSAVGSTTIKTGFFELDFGVGGDPGLDDPTTLRKQIEDLQAQQTKGAEHTQNLPVRLTPVPF